MPSPQSWLLSWLLNEVAGCGGARTEPPSSSCAVAVVAGGWPSRVPCLPAIVHDYVTYLVWQPLSLKWLRVYCRSGGRPPGSHNSLSQRKTCVLPDAHLRLLYNLALGSCGSLLIEYLSSLLKMRILEVAPLVVALPLVVPLYFDKLVLVLCLI